MRLVRNIPSLILLLVMGSMPLLGGCAIGYIAAGMGQNFENQKLLEILPQYDGLEHQTVAVVVDADLATLYEHPTLCDTVAEGVSAKMRPGGRYLDATRAEWPLQVKTTRGRGYSAMERQAARATLWLEAETGGRSSSPGREKKADCSASMAIRFMTRSDSMGKEPTAVSPESMTASVPSRMALATSVVSARVGRGLRSMESSICVAVITRTPARLAARIRPFW